MSDKVVVLEVVEPGKQPSYCVHGKATCYSCDEWVWLGDETFKLVDSGEALPLCLPCATKHIQPGAEKIGEVRDH